MEINFDEWEDYIPVGEISPPKIDNPNIFCLYFTDDFISYSCDDKILTKEEFEKEYEIFDSISEEDYEGNSFIRFIKEKDILYNKEKISIFSHKDKETFLLIKNVYKYLISNYQNTGYYVDDNKLTFTGWDSNIIINLKDMKQKTKWIR